MNASEVRREFLRFFEERGHQLIASDSLVPPAEDKSLLFTGAGMNQFKNEFMGRGKPGLKRAVTCQKCLRTGDLENVGRVPFYHAFFEMLGNFSFGDYFKRETIVWAWEFMTNEMKLPAEKLAVSIYEDDEDAFRIWNKEIGLSERIIFRYGEHDNFWPADAPKLGPNGLCGPCSEIFYDWGAAAGCGKPTCGPACDCKRFLEIWNLVFQQFERRDGGALVQLPSENIDTGMGFERMAAVMQGVRTSFETDLFLPLLEAVEREVDLSYKKLRDTKKGIGFRRIADHVRAACFCISDGVLPGNTGRDYVLRKLIRRAALDGNNLGLNKPFLYRLVPAVTGVMGEQYPDLRDRMENIARQIRIEEERFHQTLDQGQAILQETISELRASGSKNLPGTEAFRLFDTYGLPFDVTQTLLEDEGFGTDPGEFEAEMERQRELSRKGTKISTDIFGSGPIAELKEQGVGTLFDGYEQDETDGKVAGIIVGKELRDAVMKGDEAVIVLDRTTYYGESGGEVGDTGILEAGGARFEVTDSQRAEGMVLHSGRVISGTISKGDLLRVKPDVARRAAIRRNHTATHLMHHALRQVLGRHAEQAGSLVAPERLRFDFHHTQAVKPEELRLVEDKVNGLVLKNDTITWRNIPLSQAKAQGAMALFGEKYGEEVRLLDIGGYSKELCGGLHCDATGKVGLFKIVGESSVAAGIRRIEAVTGLEALKHLRTKEEMLERLAELLGAPESRLLDRAKQLETQVRELRKELQKARQSSRPGAAEYLRSAKEIGGAKVITAVIEGAGAEELRLLADQLRQMAPSVAVALGSAAEGRVNLIVAFSKDLVDHGLHAGKTAGEAAKLVGGGGGGRPDMAQAGGKDAGGLAKAIETAGMRIEENLRRLQPKQST